MNKIRDFIKLFFKLIKETVKFIKDIYTVDGKFQEVFKFKKTK